MAKADELKAMIAERRAASSPSPAPASPPNRAFPTTARPAASGQDAAHRVRRLSRLRRGPPRDLAPQVRQPRGAAEGDAQRRTPRARPAGRAGQDDGRRHAEHRRPAPGLRRARRQGDRAARQRHLRGLPRLPPALRARLGARDLRRRRAAPPLHGLRRHDQDGDHLVRPVDAGGRDGAGARGDARGGPVHRARQLSGGLSGRRLSHAGQAQRSRASSSSIASRPTRTSWPTSSSMPRSAPP